MFCAFLSLGSSVVLLIVRMLASLFSFTVSNQSKFVALENRQSNTDGVYLDVLWCFYCCCTVCMCVYCRPLPSHWRWLPVSPSSDRWRLVLTLSVEMFSWQRSRCQLVKSHCFKCQNWISWPWTCTVSAHVLPSASVGLSCWTVCVCVRVHAWGFSRH